MQKPLRKILFWGDKARNYKEFITAGKFTQGQLRHLRQFRKNLSKEIERKQYSTAPCLHPLTLQHYKIERAALRVLARL